MTKFFEKVALVLVYSSQMNCGVHVGVVSRSEESFAAHKVVEWHHYWKAHEKIVHYSWKASVVHVGAHGACLRARRAKLSFF